MSGEGVPIDPLIAEIRELVKQLVRIGDRLDSWDRTWQGRSQTFHQLSTVGTVFNQESKGSRRDDDDDRRDRRR